MKEKKGLSLIMKILKGSLIAAALLLIIFCIGRYGWKLGGFDACESAGIERVEVTGGQVAITGFYPGSFPQGFLGYHAEEKDGKLYVGFQFSGVFGIFETGDFEITIPTKGEIREVYIKTSENEHLIWSAEEAAPEETTPTEPDRSSAYAEIINTYASAIAQDWNGQQLMDAGLNYMIADLPDPASQLGYAISDLDGDGWDDLTIGAIMEDNFYGKLVFALYTLDAEGEPMLLFESGERDCWYYAGGFRFANLGSSGWNDSFVTTLKLEDKEMVDMTYTTDPSDYVQMELTSFRRMEE